MLSVGYRSYIVSNARQILTMLNSKTAGDDNQFYATALQVAAAEARSGRRTVAEQLRKAVEDARKTATTTPISISKPRGDLTGLLELRKPAFGLRDVILGDAVQDKVFQVLEQQRKRSILREFGKTPSRRLLFVGQPGAGKTMTAEAIAHDLDLPLFIIRMESLITRYMGATAAQMRLIFDSIASTRGVYLFDEFDALGGQRNATNDVAEMRRVLNSFLQFIEEPVATDAILIGATNHPEILDKALLRRFDAIIKFDAPKDEEIKNLIRQNLKPMKFPRLDWKKIAGSAHGLSQAEITQAIDETVKLKILAEDHVVTTSDLIGQLESRKGMGELFTSTL